MNAELRLPRSRRPVATRTSLRTRPVPVLLYLAVLILLPALVVTGSMAAGWWSTAGHAGGAFSASELGREGAGGGQPPAPPARPDDVKGSMTVHQVVAAFPPVTAAEVLAAFGAPSGTPDTAPLRTLVESGNGTDIPAFRTWLRQRLS
jgi:hypothetical protein